jgi:hypothetical protein
MDRAPRSDMWKVKRSSSGHTNAVESVGVIPRAVLISITATTATRHRGNWTERARFSRDLFPGSGQRRPPRLAIQ